MSLRCLGIVPARGGSKRLPRKNVQDLGGKPLIAWVIEAARQAESLSRLIVSSDDAAILSVAREYDEAIALPRPTEYATDTAPAIDYVHHALEVLERAGEARFDAVVILQPTSPFTLASDIDATVALLEQSGADSAVSVVEIDHAVHPLKMKLLEGDRLLPYLEDEQGRFAAHQLPKIYARNCSVYATRRASIDQGLTIGPDCRGYEMPRERSLDINEELDLLFARFLLSRNATS